MVTIRVPNSVVVDAGDTIRHWGEFENICAGAAELWR